MVVGIDNRIENNLARINLEISEKKKDEEVLKTEIVEFQNREEALEDRIGELAQEGHKTTVESRSQKETLEKLKESKERENIAKVLLLIKHLSPSRKTLNESQSSRSKKRVHIPKRNGR